MKQLLIILLAAIVPAAQAQGLRWQVYVQAQPELTLHPARYDDGGRTNTATLNVGAGAGLRLYVTEQVFATAGLAFIDRRIAAAAILFQAGLPRPQQSFSAELVTTKSLQYRTISFPVGAGYCFQRGTRFSSYVTAGIAANYLLDASYRSNLSRYDGRYAKHAWQGFTMTGGAGTEYRSCGRLGVTADLSYSVINKVVGDEFLLAPRQGYQAPDYQSLRLAIGLTFTL